MKIIIVTLIVLTPFIGVSQVSSTSVNPINRVWTLRDDLVARDSDFIKADTLSAYLLVTTKHMGIAYQRRGFIVRQLGKEDVYLDCDKRVIKAPYTIWHSKIINQPK